MPQTKRHISYLDGWRGMAIALVLFSHFIAGADLGADYGRLGVDIFFVLSGMLMSDLLFRQRVALRLFYRRRISRIVPAFGLYVVVVYAVSWFFGSASSWGAVLSTLLFLRTYLPASPDIWHSGLPLAHLWSLNVEEHCYLVMGMATLFLKNRLLAAVVLGSTGMAALVMLLTYARNPGLAPPTYALRSEVASSFVFLSASYSLVKERFAMKVPSWMPLVVFVAGGLCYYWRLPWWASAILSPLLFSFTVNHLDRTPPLVRAALSGKAIRRLGLYSFSIYLWQQPWYFYKDHFPAGIAMLGAILCGVASFYLIEQPARTWLNANWRSKLDRAPEVVNAS